MRICSHADAFAEAAVLIKDNKHRARSPEQRHRLMIMMRVRAGSVLFGGAPCTDVFL
jgi:hypothetical protein